MTYYQDSTVTLHHRHVLDVLPTLADGSVDCAVTSPPYFGLRSYLPEGHPDKHHEIGAEKTPAEYVEKLRGLFAEVRRVLADDGVLWLNLGDSYSSGGRSTYDADSKTMQTRARGYNTLRPASDRTGKNLLGIPWRVAFALQDDGWILRNAICWEKGNAMPESVTDRLSSRYEMLFLFSKSRRYFFDLDPIREVVENKTGGTRGVYGSVANPGGAAHSGLTRYHDLGKNPGDVWKINTVPFAGARTGRPRPDRHDQDAPAYGMQRIASPDCPLHASADRPGSSGPDGARAEDVSHRIPDSDAHLAPVQAADCVPTQTLSGRSSVPSRSGSSLPDSADSANPRNTGTHRTGLDPETTRPCTPSAQSPNGTGHSGGQLAFDAQRPHTSVSNMAAADSHGRGKKAQSIADKCSCSWVDSTEKLDHFAVFPPELPRRCILAGCKPGGTVLDPFHGSGTTGMVAQKLGRKYVGIELNKDYLDLSLRTRLADGVLDFEEPA